MARELAIVEPSGAAVAAALKTNLDDLERRGFRLRRFEYPEAVGPRLGPQGSATRAALLQQALAASEVVLCGRGGYGASDLLERLDWERLAALPPRLVAGFSDISALHSALYARLGWKSLHAPMPGSTLWRPEGEDVAATVAVLAGWPDDCSGRIEVNSRRPPRPLRGTLFGGCFSVLSDLLGTRYFPSTLADHVLFLEDVNEPLPRILRILNRWIQTGCLQGVTAIVLGRFTHRDPVEAALLEALPEHVADRVGVPVLCSADFGHVDRNLPLLVGARCEILDATLTWARRRDSE